jgi:hypothetical protein
MGANLGKVIAAVARTLGFALLAGLGGELAKTAGEQMRTKLKKKDDEETPEEAAKRRQDELEAEVKRLRQELDALRQGAHPARDGDR